MRFASASKKVSKLFAASAGSFVISASIDRSNGDRGSWRSFSTTLVSHSPRSPARRGGPNCFTVSKKSSLTVCDRSIAISLLRALGLEGPHVGAAGVRICPIIFTEWLRLGPELIERIPVVEYAALHHQLNVVCVVNVVERIRIQHQQVGQFPRFNCAEVLFHSEEPGSIAAGHFQRAHWTES